MWTGSIPPLSLWQSEFEPPTSHSLTYASADTLSLSLNIKYIPAVGGASGGAAQIFVNTYATAGGAKTMHCIDAGHSGCAGIVPQADARPRSWHSALAPTLRDYPRAELGHR